MLCRTKRRKEHSMDEQQLLMLIRMAREEVRCLDSEWGHVDPIYGLALMCLDVACGLVSSDGDEWDGLPDKLNDLHDELGGWIQ